MLLKGNFNGKDNFFLASIFDQIKLVASLFWLLLIFWKSADIVGCMKLQNKKEVNKIFFEIPEFKVNEIKINLEDFLNLSYLVF